MNIAVANVPMAIYALCKPNVVPLVTTAPKFESPNGRACVVVESESVKISFVFTTASNINSSEGSERRENHVKTQFL